ncbi:MAG: PxKF domain-containing protein [Acidobacteria bacterium]|nr:PxKF domain-containing protein [Acidobacteriota bacterium]
MHAGSAGSTALTVRGNTSTVITGDAPSPSGTGQAVTVSFAVAPAAPAVGVPTGSVTVTDGIGGSCTATLAAGSCPLAPALAGTVTLTATYSGDVFFSASSGTRLHSVVPPYNFTGFLTPLSAAGTLAAPSNSGEANFTQGVPVKWQLTDSSGNTVTDLTSTQTLSASYYTGGVCTAGAATGPSSLLYNPTTGATGGSTFRTSGGAFIFNWATKKLATGPGCYEVILQLNDGSAPRATQITLR